MSYTAEDIKVPLYKYEQGMLAIDYRLPGDDKPKTKIFPNTSLITVLKDTYIIYDGNPYSGIVKVGANYPWISIEQYMSHNLNDSMASVLILHYLNNKPVKP